MNDNNIIATTPRPSESLRSSDEDRLHGFQRLSFANNCAALRLTKEEQNLSEVSGKVSKYSDLEVKLIMSIRIGG